MCAPPPHEIDTVSVSLSYMLAAYVTEKCPNEPLLLEPLPPVVIVAWSQCAEMIGSSRRYDTRWYLLGDGIYISGL